MSGKRSFVLSFTVLFSTILLLALFGVTGFGVEVSAETTPPRAAFTDQRDAADAAANWIATTHQKDDGGYGNFGFGDSAASGTLDAILAIASTGYNPGIPMPGEMADPVSFLRASSADLKTYADSNGGAAGKTVMGLVAAHENPADFAGEDYIVALTNHFSPTGEAGSTATLQSFAMLGIAAANAPMPANAVTHLISLQAADGSWDDGFGTSPNTDATAMAIMALIAAGESPTSSAVMAAKMSLANTQSATGWAYGGSGSASPNSTALAIQALAALGEDFYTGSSPWAQGGKSAQTLLLDMQVANGAVQADFGSGPADNLFATLQAVPAITGKAYPLAGRYAAVTAAVSCLTDVLYDGTEMGWTQFEDSASFPQSVNAAGTSRAIQALARAGAPIEADYMAGLAAQTPGYIAGQRGGRPGVVAQGVEFGGGDITAFAGLDLPMLINDQITTTGEYDSTAFGPVAHIEAMLGLIDAGISPDFAAINWLVNAQAADGTWGSPDSTGIALQALGKMKLSTSATTLSTLKSTQFADGGWAGFGSSASPSSTSEVIQGIWATGEMHPFSPNWSVVISGTVVNAADTLMATQDGSNGCWKGFSGGDDPFSTTDALILLTVENDNRSHDVLPNKIFLPIVMK